MPKRGILIAGNWKMHNTAAAAAALAAEVAAGLANNGTQAGVQVVVCPPFTALAAVLAALGERSPIAVGAQNVHWAESGAFTGEIAAAMLLEIGVRYAIIGHSERRQYFGETDAGVNQRLHAALQSGLTPIVCVGESLEQRERGDTEAVVSGQVDAGLAGLSPEQMQQTVVAYEPIWAIGTGLTASPAQAQELHALIRTRLQAEFGAAAATVRILYGGSVKPSNAGQLLQQEDIDGALVGGASLKAADFLAIVAAAGHAVEQK
jgi:triosephosphate isomerase